ncbi:TonB-dependent receptor [Bryobacter aggregatus]|uniref:TonB-dependent receptor n=1 Tax=Bryobacter aggregatus TaxID=360054 RepID=UPI0004E1D387|nr:carboxypeptidase-like regulatory domain-containing protein [Bryobacter aggregatus]
MLQRLNMFSIAAILAVSLSAQQGGGLFTGAATDPQGSPVSGAKLIVRNLATNATFESLTNADGLFTTPTMPVGSYEISCEKTGFKRSVRRDLTLQVDQRAQVDFTLDLGQVSETVEVKSEIAMLDTASATVGKVVEERVVKDLPLNGRNALALTLLTPSVKSNAGPTNSGFTDRGTTISSISINGGPNGMNNQILDGNTNILSFVGEVGIPPAVDAVQEFKVQSGTMPAEFGFTAGGVINLVLKSGANAFHGNAYEFLRNDKLDARNTFAPQKNPLRYNQYGGSLGGRIIRDRTFFFGNFEEYKLRQGSPTVASTPLAEWRQGNFSRLLNGTGDLVQIYDPATTRTNPNGSGLIRDVFPGNIIPTNRLDPVAQAVLKYYPLPNRTPTNSFTQANNYQRQGINQVDSRQYHIKVDHRFSDQNSAFARYSFFNHKPFSTGFFEDPIGNSRTDIVQNHNFVMGDIHSFSPTLINEFRAGGSRQYFTFISSSYGLGIPQKLGLPASVPSDVMPTFAFGYTNIGNPTVGTRGSLNWQFTDIVTKVAGKHTLRAGFELRLNQGSNQQTSQPSGTFNFNATLTSNPQNRTNNGNGLASFILGQTASASADRVVGSTMRAPSYTAFIQDDFRVTRRLTLNLGLRYDFQKQPTEMNNGVSNYSLSLNDPTTGLPGRMIYAGVDGAPTSFRKEDYNDFGPRFGFAYDVGGNARTVVRGGYAIFYPAIFFRNNFYSTSGFGSTTTTYVAPGGNSDYAAFQLSQGFPTPLVQPQGSKLGPNPFIGQNVSFTEAKQSTPMSQQWNLAIQRVLGKGWVIETAYSGNKGTHFNAAGYDVNQMDPQYLSLGASLRDNVVNPYAGKVGGAFGGATITRAQSLRPYPYLGGVSTNNPRLGGYISHLFLMSVERRMRQGLTVMFSYTGGKIISDSLASPIDFGGVEQVTETGYQNGKFDRRSNRSTDPSDVSQRGTLSLLYELPFGQGQRFKSSHAAINTVLGGWQLNSIGVMQTGLPLIVRGATSTIGTANRPNSTGKSAKLDNPTPQRWFDPLQFVNPTDFTFGNVGRVLPDVRGPGTINWDLSAIKNTRLRETVNLQFRLEYFNVFNHVNYGQPATTFTAGANGQNVNGAAGTITSARDARIGQVALKLIF